MANSFHGRRGVTLALAGWCALALLGARDVRAGEIPRAVALQAQVIYAANQPGGVDARLGSLATNLQKTFRYSMYQLLSAPTGSTALNQVWRTGLPDDRALEITPTGVQEGQVSLTVRVLAAGGQPLVNTAVRLKHGSTVLVGAPPHQQGVLIIAISAP
jgi:cell division inhibitor SulA